MANRAYLYSSNRADDWNHTEADYHDSRWNIPLAWWFFYAVDDLVWVDAQYDNSRWREVKLSTRKSDALARFTTRRPLLISMLEGGLSEDDIDRFVMYITNRRGEYLLLDPEEVYSGSSISDEEHEAKMRKGLTALDDGTIADELAEYANLSSEYRDWEGKVFGYTYTWP